MTITYSFDKEVESDSIRDLFLSVNWPIGNKPDKLQQAFSQSDQVITACDGERIVGLINAISDGVITAYIPYLLVSPDYQKQGIGGELVSRIIAKYKNYERIVLLTEEDTVDFYRKCGFIEPAGVHVMMITH